MRERLGRTAAFACSQATPLKSADRRFAGSTAQQKTKSFKRASATNQNQRETAVLLMFGMVLTRDTTLGDVELEVRGKRQGALFLAKKRDTLDTQIPRTTLNISHLFPKWARDPGIFDRGIRLTLSCVSLKRKAVAAIPRGLEGPGRSLFFILPDGGAGSMIRLCSAATHRRGKQSNAQTIRGSVKSVILSLDDIPDVTQPKHRENPCREEETFLLHCHAGEVLLRRTWPRVFPTPRAPRRGYLSAVDSRADGVLAGFGIVCRRQWLRTQTRE